MATKSDQPVDTAFERLEHGGHTSGTSRAIGGGFIAARDRIARALIGLGATPNTVTTVGCLATAGAAVLFFYGGGFTHAALRDSGAPPYLVYAGVLLFIAGACDMLDGAVARIGRLGTPFGGFFDSTLDRLSDFLIYIGLIGHFAWTGNLTYTILSAAAMANAFLISYTKSRAETLIPDCSVGYWFRGERSAAVFIACLAGHLPAVLWQQAILPFFTVLRRMVWTHQVLSAQSAGRPAPAAGPSPGVAGLLRPWRFPRGSIPYDLVTAANIAFILLAPYWHPIFTAGRDPLGRLLAGQ